MNLIDYLSPLDQSEIKQYADSSFSKQHVTFFSSTISFPVDENYTVALLGLPDSSITNSFEAPKCIRKQLYKLSAINKCRIIDLGNIKTGNTFNDTCFAIRDIVEYFNSQSTIVLFLGGNTDYNVGSYMAFNKKQAQLNMVSIDSNISREKIPIFLISKIVLAKTEAFQSHFNYINIGYQSYYVDRSIIDLIDDSKYEAYRLGFVRSNLKEMEPVLRDSNMVSLSINSIKYSDAPASTNNSPNGFFGDEACQLAFYAGYSTRLQTFGLYDFLPDKDIHDVTAKLSAQIIWYFLEGLSISIFEEPDITPDNFVKYHIYNEQVDQNISFYKSNLTNRWWMEISYPKKQFNIILSCSQNDYELACKKEIPERWWRMTQRISK